MNRDFFTILAAQFFSALADNALLFAAIAMLKDRAAPPWEIPVLQQFFVFSYIVLAPFVGPFADSLPKGRVMFISNAVKIVGCGAMLVGGHPLLAYGLVGVGAALYSPAKYGILTECLPAHRLVWANGWMEGLTVASIILGAILGGVLIGPRVQEHLIERLEGLEFHLGLTTAPEFAVALVLGIYLLAAIINLYIPQLPFHRKLPKRTLGFALRDFRQSFHGLWQDPLGKVSLAVTTLFWGAGATLRFIVLTWAATALGFNLEQATQLTALVAVGIAGGASLAAKQVSLTRAVRVLPTGIAMGLMVMVMIGITDWRLAVVLMLLIGIMAGYFVVPMNALLQHRGHLLMGAGRSIAVQNFNENLGILVMLGAYALMIRAGFGINAIVLIFGGFVALAMAGVARNHWHDQDRTPEETTRPRNRNP